MSQMSSLFAQMRESRAANMNEGVKQEDKEKETLNEGTNETGTEKTKKEEASATETQVDEGTNETGTEDVNEEVSAVFCKDCGALVSGYMNESEVDECPCCGSEELLEKVVKVVRDGKVVSKKVATKKKRLSSAQKAALSKARKKAHSSAANKQRAKSVKKRAKAGLNEDDVFECTECGYTGGYEDFSVDDDGNLICPECGAEIDESCDNQTVGKPETKKKENTKVNEETSDADDMKALLESVNAPKFVFDALNEGKNAFVTGYLNLKMGSKE